MFALLRVFIAVYIAEAPDGEECHKTDKQTVTAQHYNKVEFNTGGI